MKRSIAALLLFAGIAAHAQSSAEVNAGIQFNFASPGARSLGRGGAFIADASDATAAYANPAGLVNVPFREVSMEVRSSRFTNEYSDRGREGRPSGILDDTIAGIVEGRSTDRVRNVSFVSVVMPQRRWSFAAYRHELANFSASASSQGVFVDREGEPYRHYPAVSSLHLDIVGTGLSAAVRGPKGVRWAERMSFGAAVIGFQSKVDSVTRRYESTEFYGPPDYTRLNNVQTQQGEGRSLGVNVGYLFDVHRTLSVGATYRRGFSFPVSVTYADQFRERPPKRARFHVPSFYGAGVLVRPTDYWSLTMDVNRITYSDTTRDFVLLFEEEPRYFVPDGTEVRLGTEYIVTRDLVRWLRVPVAISAGAWRDPDHRVRVSDPTDTQSVLFRPTRADTHVSFGVGVLAGTRAQFHAAIDRSRRQTVVSLAAMGRF